MENILVPRLPCPGHVHPPATALPLRLPSALEPHL